MPEVKDKSKTLSDIQREIGEWSLENFGRNVSKVNPEMMLHSLAPILGMQEELGELVEVFYTEGEADKLLLDRLDACGDILVYLCDYACRESFSIARSIEVVCPFVIYTPNSGKRQTTDITPLDAITAGIGRLARANLKRHQGIRNHDQPLVFKKARDEAVCLLWKGMEAYLGNSATRTTPLEVLNTVWDKVVAKRNWKKSPETGNVQASQ